MAQEGSVAPKERVNIVYKSEVDGVEEDVELPFKVLVAGEFSTKADSSPIEQRKSINVDKNNFNDVMQAQDLHIDFSVKNRLDDKAEEDAELSISLNFNSIKDFEPDSIAQALPELKKLLELREALKALKGPLGNVPEFRNKITQMTQDKDTKEKLLRELQIGEE